ncbi:MAG: hypothetical protein L0211_09125 [Planctomycetaceae bacterium]|nr:hypothetical protein [Planctomycetaceae bacterium]
MTLIDFALQARDHGLAELPNRFWDLSPERREASAAAIVAAFDRERHAGFMRRYGHLLPAASNGHAIEAVAPTLPPPVTVRNLIYHVCPLVANDGWRHNVHQLLKRARLFNGRRVVAIACGDGTAKPSVVRRAFEQAGGRWDFIELPNDPVLREVVSFLPLLISVSDPSQDQATFYAHTKGNSTEQDRSAAIYWRNMMYHELLDSWQECVDDLRFYAAIGTQLMCWPPDTPPYPTRLRHGTWMFSGTFFWFRNSAVFSHPHWRSVPADRYGAEAWLSGLFPVHAVKSRWQAWPPGSYPTPSPYEPILYSEPIADDPLPDERPGDGTDIPASAWSELFKPSRPQTAIPAASLIVAPKPGPKTIIVLGAFRGGTSFIAQTLYEIGIPIGPLDNKPAEEWAYCNYEDCEIAAALAEQDWSKFAELVTARNSEPVWSFKWPRSVFLLNGILPLVRNPHFIAVTRDPFTALQSELARDAKLDLRATRNHARAVLDFLAAPRGPMLAVSYERGKERPGEVREAIRSFARL